MKKLTVIMPFLNEGEEVYHTVKSIRETAQDQVDIILINDASSDGYPYFEVSQEFNTRYIEHEERQGVAFSRNEGVNHCNSEYFILLDAHMRFYKIGWVEQIVRELEKDKRCLLCGQTIVLHKNANGEVISSGTQYSFGAYIDFNGDDPLGVKWNQHPLTKEQNISQIPCVLGASYATNKTYWQRIQGLQGLRSYGFDETLISLKVWLEGGTCKLIKDLAVGHIFREKMPYQPVSFDYAYNRLYIAELLLDYHSRHHAYKIVESASPRLFDMVMAKMTEDREMIETQKNYYQTIFTRHIKEIVDMNMVCKAQNVYNFLPLPDVTGKTPEEKQKSILEKLAGYLVPKLKKMAPGLLNGKAGLALFYAYYAKQWDRPELLKLVEDNIDQVYDRMNTATSFEFSTGLTGIAWAFNRMVEENLVEIDTEELLEDIDRKLVTYLQGMDDQQVYTGDFWGEGIYYAMRNTQLLNNHRDIFVSHCIACLKGKSESIHQMGVKDHGYFLGSVLHFLAVIDDLEHSPEARLLAEALDEYLNLFLSRNTDTTILYLIRRMYRKAMEKHPAFLTEHFNENEIDEKCMDDVLLHQEGEEFMDLIICLTLHSLLFDSVPRYMKNAALDKLLAAIEDPEKWEKMLIFFDHGKYGLNGMVGLGIFIANN